MSNSMIDRESNGDEGNAANEPQSGRVFLLRDRDSLFPRRALGGSEDAIEALAGIAAEAVGMGIRRAFRIPLAIMVVVALSALSLFSYHTLSSSELDGAEKSVRSEINYLCLQLQSLDERSEAFSRVVDTSTEDAGEQDAAEQSDYRLLSDPVGDLLNGYTLAETGTVAIVADDVVVASDDERLPVGADVRTSLGERAYGAIGESIESGEFLPIPLQGALAPTSSGADTEGFLMAARQGDYTAVIVEPSDMVYRDRESTMFRMMSMTLAVLALVFIGVDRLLIYVVARRIDKTNAALERITAGDLDVRVKEEGTREFRSLAQRINITVDALNGWIDEAENRMSAELATAKAIQEAALPRTFPPFPGFTRFDLFASMDSAREVGGDFYDFFLVGEGCTPEAGKLAFVVADVSGKGVPAALFMMRAKALIRNYVSSGMELGAAMAEANRAICDGNDAGMFVTAWVGVLDYATGHVDYVNAGHNPPLLWQGGSWEWLREKSGMVLGLFDMPYKTHAVDCEAGDAFLLYTDGVTEAFDVEGTLYGEERLLALVRGCEDRSPQALQRLVRDDVAVHAQGAEQSDDITILALEVGGELRS